MLRKEGEEEGSRVVVGREYLYHEKEWWGKRRGSRTGKMARDGYIMGVWEGGGEGKEEDLGERILKVL